MAKTKLKRAETIIHNKKKEDDRRRWALQYKLARMQRKAYRAKKEANKKESECKLQEFFANCTDILPPCDVSCAEPYDILPVTMYEPDLFNLLRSFVDHQ